MGVGAILDTAKQALFAQQRALQVVGQNIANVNTPGYSRENPVLLAAGPSHSDVMRSGVSVDQVTRVYDRFVTGQVNTATARFSSTQTKTDYLGQIEALFNDLNLEKGGLATNLDQVPKDKDILVVCQGGTRSLRAARFLHQMGYRKVTNLLGGTSGWREAGNPVE